MIPLLCRGERCFPSPSRCSETHYWVYSATHANPEILADLDSRGVRTEGVDYRIAPNARPGFAGTLYYASPITIVRKGSRVLVRQWALTLLGTPNLA